MKKCIIVIVALIYTFLSVNLLLRQHLARPILREHGALIHYIQDTIQTARPLNTNGIVQGLRSIPQELLAVCPIVPVMEIQPARIHLI